MNSSSQSDSNVSSTPAKELFKAMDSHPDACLDVLKELMKTHPDMVKGAVKSNPAFAELFPVEVRPGVKPGKSRIQALLGRFERKSKVPETKKVNNNSIVGRWQKPKFDHDAAADSSSSGAAGGGNNNQSHQADFGGANNARSSRRISVSAVADKFEKQSASSFVQSPNAAAAAATAKPLLPPTTWGGAYVKPVSTDWKTKRSQSREVVDGKFGRPSATSSLQKAQDDDQKSDQTIEQVVSEVESITPEPTGVTTRQSSNNAKTMVPPVDSNLSTAAPASDSGNVGLLEAAAMVSAESKPEEGSSSPLASMMKTVTSLLPSMSFGAEPEKTEEQPEKQQQQKQEEEAPKPKSPKSPAKSPKKNKSKGKLKSGSSLTGLGANAVIEKEKSEAKVLDGNGIFGVPVAVSQKDVRAEAKAIKAEAKMQEQAEFGSKKSKGQSTELSVEKSSALPPMSPISPTKQEDKNAPQKQKSIVESLMSAVGLSPKSSKKDPSPKNENLAFPGPITVQQSTPSIKPENSAVSVNHPDGTTPPKGRQRRERRERTSLSYNKWGGKSDASKTPRKSMDVKDVSDAPVSTPKVCVDDFFAKMDQEAKQKSVGVNMTEFVAVNSTAGSRSATPESSQQAAASDVQTLAFRAAVKDDWRTLMDLIADIPDYEWTEWKNRGGFTLLQVCENRKRAFCQHKLRVRLGLETEAQEIEYGPLRVGHACWVNQKGSVAPEQGTVRAIQPAGKESMKKYLIEFWNENLEDCWVQRPFLELMERQAGVE